MNFVGNILYLRYLSNVPAVLHEVLQYQNKMLMLVSISMYCKISCLTDLIDDLILVKRM